MTYEVNHPNCSFLSPEQNPLSRHASLCSLITNPATTFITASLKPLPSSSCPYQLSELRNGLQARGCRRSVTIRPKICLRLGETNEQIGLHPPGPNQAVYREDCTQCFDSIVSSKYDVILPIETIWNKNSRTIQQASMSASAALMAVAQGGGIIALFIMQPHSTRWFLIFDERER